MLDLATCGWRSQSDPWRCEEPSSFTKPTGHKEGFSLQKIAKPLRDVFPKAMSNLITWCQQSEAITESPDSLIARFLHWLHCKPSTCFVLLKWLKCDSEITWMVFWFGLSRCLEFLQLHQQPDSASATANKGRLGTFYTLGRLTTATISD